MQEKINNAITSACEGDRIYSTIGWEPWFSRVLLISTSSSCYYYLRDCIVDDERRVPNMNQEKIGKFIAECRKEQGFTQAALTEKLGITDRAILQCERVS